MIIPITANPVEIGIVMVGVIGGDFERRRKQHAPRGMDPFLNFLIRCCLRRGVGDSHRGAQRQAPLPMLLAQGGSPLMLLTQGEGALMLLSAAVSLKSARFSFKCCLRKLFGTDRRICFKFLNVAYASHCKRICVAYARGGVGMVRKH